MSLFCKKMKALFLHKKIVKPFTNKESNNRTFGGWNLLPIVSGNITEC